jgi:hypothetical protein
MELDAADDLSGLWRQPAATLVCTVAGAGDVRSSWSRFSGDPSRSSFDQCGTGKELNQGELTARGPRADILSPPARKSNLLVRLSNHLRAIADPAMGRGRNQPSHLQLWPIRRECRRRLDGT